MYINKLTSIDNLTQIFPNDGIVTWIGLRTERKKDLLVVEEVEAIVNLGLKGDHYSGKSGSRDVTLIQYEHILAVASFLSVDKIDPNVLRRNIVVKGLNLLSLKDKKFRIGEALLEMTGQCHPCSRMEENLGPGGYNAMRNHGGITARILEGGIIKLNDKIVVENIN